MDTPTFLGQPRTQQRILIPAHGTRFRPIWDPVAFGGTRGSKIYGLGITSSDASANTIVLAIGKALTLGSNVGTGAFVDGGGGSDSITRTSGSFVTDGWNIGDPLQLLGASTLANDFKALLTSVAAGTIAMATGTVQAAENLLATTKLYRIAQLGIIDVPANSGYITANASVNGLNVTEMPWINAKPDDFLTLGADDVLMAAAGTALGTGETIDITAFGADY